MGKSGDRKRSKKSKRSKRVKSSKNVRMSTNARQSEYAPQPPQPDAGAEPILSADSQAVVIELQRTELSRLLRDQQRLNDRIDQLLQLHEREQVLRQQMQEALDKLAAQRALPQPENGNGGHDRLVARVHRAEGRFAQLQSAVGLLVTALERRTASAQSGRA